MHAYLSGVTASQGRLVVSGSSWFAWEWRSSRLDRLHTPDDMASRGEVGSGTLGEEAARAWGVPPFKSGFPAFAARSSKVPSNGRKRRSCSPD